MRIKIPRLCRHEVPLGREIPLDRDDFFDEVCTAGANEAGSHVGTGVAGKAVFIASPRVPGDYTRDGESWEEYAGCRNRAK